MALTLIESRDRGHRKLNKLGGSQGKAHLVENINKGIMRALVLGSGERGDFRQRKLTEQRCGDVAFRKRIHNWLLI